MITPRANTVASPFAALLLLLASPFVAAETRPPNFILIYADDQGYNDLGCFGSTRIKTPQIDRMIFFSEKTLRKAVSAYIEHYHMERSHQGLKNRLIQATDRDHSATGRIRCRKRLGGMLRYDHRQAASA